MFFRSVADFGRFIGNLLRTLLKYNALEDFQEVFCKTFSALYFRRLSRILLISLHSLLKYNVLEDFMKVLTECSHMSPFYNRSECFDKFLCLIFLHFVTSCCIKFLPFSKTKTLQPQYNLFDLKTPNFI